MKNIPFVDLGAHHRPLVPAFRRKFNEILRRSQFILGPELEAFEREFATYLGAKHVVGVANGTEALVLALKAVGIGPGHEVIVPAFTFAATAFAVSQTGAVPRFVDVDERHFTIDPAKLSATPRTKAILPVHLFGQPADLDPILDFARSRNLHVVEDAAQAHGATYRNRRVGTFGIAGCFSFYPTKNLGALGDGGAVVTNDAALAERLRMWRNVGRRGWYEHAVIGHNSRLDPLQAAFLRVKLPRLDAANRKRARIAAVYDRALRGTVATPTVRDGSRHVYHLYTIRSPHRDRVREALEKAGIACGVYYPSPLHRQTCYSGNTAEAPVSDRLSKEALSIPIYPELPLPTARKIAEVIRRSMTSSG